MGFKDITRTKTTNHKTAKSMLLALKYIEDFECFWDRVQTKKTEHGYQITRFKYETERW